MNAQQLEQLDKLDELLEIAKIQYEIKKLGYQWQEQIFNDDIANPDDCCIDLTKETDPCIFEYPNYATNMVGWGRFP